MVRACLKKCLAFALVAVAAVTASARAEWPNFRGPNYDGISDETGFKTTWTDSPPLVWERTIGSGFSSIACVGDKIYTCGTQKAQQVIFCLDADTG